MNRRSYLVVILTVGLQLVSCSTQNCNSSILEICILNYSNLGSHHSQPRLEIKMNPSCMNKESNAHLLYNKKKYEMNQVWNSDSTDVKFTFEGPFYFKSLKELKSEIIQYNFVIANEMDTTKFNLKSLENLFVYQLNDTIIDIKNNTKMNEKLESKKYVEQVLN